MEKILPFVVLGGKEEEEEKSNYKRKSTKMMVAVDDSECSSHALRWALEHLCGSLEQSQEVLLCTVQPECTLGYIPPSTYGPARMFTAMSITPELIRSLKESQRNISMELLERARHLCTKYGVSARVIVEVGKPGETICKAVKKLGVDLLILGSHEKGAVERAFIGSVSNYCTQNANCAVLVVKRSI